MRLVLPFQATTLAPMKIPENGQETTDKVIRVSRERYTAPREIVEAKIVKWSGLLSEDEDEEMQERTETKIERLKDENKKSNNNQSSNTNNKNKNNKELTPTKCDSCGKEISVPFKPDGLRPVYCNDCFNKIKFEKEDQQKEKTSKSLSLEDAFSDEEDDEPIHKER